MGFQKIAHVGDLWNGEMVGLEVNGRQLLLLNVGDRFYAYADVCPHQKSRLSEGTLSGNTLRCARHHWEFDVTSGAGLNPQNTCLQTLPVRLEGEDILVDTNTDIPPEAEVGKENQR